MFRRILNCDYEFVAPWWDDVSENAKVGVMKDQDCGLQRGIRGFKRQLRLRQRKLHVKINICANVFILQLFPLARVLSCYQRSLEMDWWERC